jgi:hypothetical protein
MCACMCVCVCVHIYVCIYIYICVCMRIRHTIRLISSNVFCYCYTEKNTSKGVHNIIDCSNIMVVITEQLSDTKSK